MRSMMGDDVRLRRARDLCEGDLVVCCLGYIHVVIGTFGGPITTLMVGPPTSINPLLRQMSWGPAEVFNLISVYKDAYDD